MSLRGRRDLIPIACVSVEDWQVLHEYCRRHDVEAGGDYDATAGGAINVYLAHDWINPEAGLHGTYYGVHSRHFGYIDVFWQTGTYLNDAGVYPWETDRVSYSWDGNWNPHMAREHFCQLFQRATGKPYAIFLTDAIDKR